MKTRETDNCHFNSKLDKYEDVQTYECNVRIFNEVTKIYHFNKYYNGSDLISKICKDLNIVEKQFFGIQYLSKTKSNKRWLKPNKNILKSLQGVRVFEFNFTFQYYPPSCHCINDFMTFYFLVEQMRLNIMGKRIECPNNLRVLLSVKLCKEQNNFEDFDPHTSMNILREEMMNDLKLKKEFDFQYQNFKYLSMLEMDKLFLEEIFNLPEYGMELYYSKPMKKIGISPNEIVRFKNGLIYRICCWSHFVTCSSRFGSIIITYFDESEKLKTKKFKSSDRKFLVNLIKQSEGAFKVFSKQISKLRISILDTVMKDHENIMEKPSVPTKKFPSRTASYQPVSPQRDDFEYIRTISSDEYSNESDYSSNANDLSSE